MRHAIIIFTKVPAAGEVKTRLTEARGGILTSEEAATFYTACLMDLIDVCTSIDHASVWICYNKNGDKNKLQTLLQPLNNYEKIAGIFADQGGSFDECMQYAVDYLFKPARGERLAESVLILGGDVCGLQAQTLTTAIEKLERLSKSAEGQIKETGRDSSDIGAAMVVSADQEAGFNLVGFTHNTPFDFRSVFYNTEGITALEMLAEKASEKRIPLLPLDIVFDIDLPVDLASMIPILKVLEQAKFFDPSVMVPARTIAVLKEIGLQSWAMPDEV